MRSLVLRLQERCYSMGETTRFGVSPPAQLIESFGKMIRRKGYRTRSEASRDLMSRETWYSPLVA